MYCAPAPGSAGGCSLDSGSPIDGRYWELSKETAGSVPFLMSSAMADGGRGCMPLMWRDEVCGAFWNCWNQPRSEPLVLAT
jgi:hypothetical protein